MPPAKKTPAGRGAPKAAAAAEAREKAPRVNDGDYRDHEWLRTLTDALNRTPLCDTLDEALESLSSLASIDLGALRSKLQDKKMEWRAETPPRLTRLGLKAPDYAPTPALVEDRAASIYAYTSENPSLYSLLKQHLTSVSRAVNYGGGVSPPLSALLKYLKFLIAALEALPEKYIHRSAREGNRPCMRGEKWVFPSPTDHDPAKKYPPGSLHAWYGLLSTSTENSVMDHPQVRAAAASP